MVRLLYFYTTLRNSYLSRAISVDDRSGIPTADFAPERHLGEFVGETATDPNLYAFGFGRRYDPIVEGWDKQTDSR